MKRKAWTKVEDQFLSEKKGELSHEEIATALNRTVESINRRVSRIGIAKKRTGSRMKNGLKTCSKCLKLLASNKFNNNKTRLDGKDCWCKYCRREKHLEKTYDVPPEEYQKWYNLQKGCCAICLKKHDVLHIDHDHVTGKIRELLCRSCNSVLGFASDNPNTLAKAILYLKKHNIKISTFEAGAMTAEYLVGRSKCCGNGCKNCPY